MKNIISIIESKYDCETKLDKLLDHFRNMIKIKYILEEVEIAYKYLIYKKDALKRNYCKGDSIFDEAINIKISNNNKRVQDSFEKNVEILNNSVKKYIIDFYKLSENELDLILYNLLGNYTGIVFLNDNVVNKLNKLKKIDQKKR